MELLYLSTFATIFCTIFVFSLKYLSLLRWISGRAYVLRQNQQKLTAEEVLDIIKNATPFPVSCQKGWKIHQYTHGHRLWFHFLTIPNATIASLKVFAVFSKLRASPQSVLQLLKDISMSCEWKPGVVATSYVHDGNSSEIVPKSKDFPSMPVRQDIIREERVCYRPFDAWWQPDITQTSTEEHRRFWHREENGCCWLLQMNEKQQAWTFFLAQPVEDADQSLVTVVTWSCRNNGNENCAMAAATLGSLREFLHMRKIQSTPLHTISLPHALTRLGSPLTTSTPKAEDPKAEGKKPHKLLNRFRSFIEKNSPGNSPSKMDVQKEEMKKCSNILRFGSSATVEKTVVNGGSAGTGDGGKTCVRGGSGISRESDGKSDISSTDGGSALAGEQGQAGERDTASEGEARKQPVGNGGKQVLQRSSSDTSALRQTARKKNQPQNIPEAVSEQPHDPATISRYRTQANQAAAELLAQVLMVSNLDLGRQAEEQLATAGGWMFYGCESDIVILKKIPKVGSYIYCYLGKGIVEAPPKTVWDAVRNPRTRFTYDESLKKVDILQNLSDDLRIVYLYHEVSQILKRESCDICMIQSERVEGEKHVLVYQSVDWETTSPKDGTVRANLLPSGWIIEPVPKGDKVHSMVTYLMQVDFSAGRGASDKMPFEDMVSKQPLSIAFLNQYLQPAVMLARRQSLPSVGH